MKKKSSQSLLKMIEISECKNFKLSNNLQDALRIFFSTIVKNTGSRNTLITDQDIIDTRQFYRAEAIHATSNFIFHDSVE